MSRNEYRVIYEGGVFKPLSPVSLPERHELVFVEKSSVDRDQSHENQEEILAVLAERYESGKTDTAERHNEHQP